MIALSRNALHIHIPALRERPDDIKPLLIHFVDHYSTKFNKPKLQISGDVFVTLVKYDFPGNVRELKNMTERAIILCKGNLLGINDFPFQPDSINSASNTEESVDLKMHEIDLIRKALGRARYNQQAAADALGIHRDALSRKMKKYNIAIEKNEG